MSSPLSADFFAGNRARIRQLFTGTAPIVITAYGRLQQGSDEAYPFSQDSSFWYLTGIDEPDVVLVMDKDKEYLIVPEKSAVSDVFDGAIDEHELMSTSGVREVMSARDGWKYLGARLKRVRYVATLAAAPAYIDVLGLYTNPARAILMARLKQHNAKIKLLDIRTHLARLRMVKQPVELAAIQAAIDVTIDTLKTITRPSQLSRYANEYEVEADISRGFRRAGAQGHAFAPIVASGQRACTLHNITNQGALASGELLVLDVGAQVNHYAADITRTVSLGQPSRRAQAVIAAVREVYDFATSLLRPGVLMHDYEKQIENFMGEKLRELGLIKSIEHEAVRHYFPHATSHFLGIDTHDNGDYERPLEPGVVMAVEPGIYIPEEAIGVRLEDDFCITADGVQCLSARLPL
ncbi:MAG TPA: Xaa-Pro peptidase family protein [Candidatus Saccharimonadales bacterium]|nr:Xaa-Pro peptidase family protein [Candidatus Saccharimonadales bacterium]